ncbi:MAG: hypothetical protein WKF32_05135 [Thermoleophilaceae bacterium]
MRPTRLFPLLLIVALLAGCGNQPSAERLARAARPSSEKVEQSFPRAGLRLELPDNLSVTRTERPGVFYASFGETVVSAFAYRRREQLPKTGAELSRALERLERATQDRDPAYVLRDSSATKVGTSRAVELVGDQTIQKQKLRTRSVHVYEGEAEYVLELLSPRKDFTRLDRDLFEPVLESLRVTGRVRRARN